MTMTSSIFLDITPCCLLSVLLPPFSSPWFSDWANGNWRVGFHRPFYFYIIRHFRRSRVLLATCVSCLTYISTLKVEVICSSKTWADFQRTTRQNSSVEISLQELQTWNLVSIHIYVSMSANSRLRSLLIVRFSFARHAEKPLSLNSVLKLRNILVEASILTLLSVEVRPYTDR
jgi:hypothetical protein